MKLNKFSNNQFQLDLNLAELRILTAIIGNHSGHSAAAIVNESTIVRDGLAKRISTFEGATFTGNYHLLHDALKEEVVEVIKVVEFVYDKGEYGVTPKWRNVHVTAENDRYIEGLEDGTTFKKFLKSRIVGGRVITIPN
jgi:hypothetical protein